MLNGGCAKPRGCFWAEDDPGDFPDRHLHDRQSHAHFRRPARLPFVFGKNPVGAKPPLGFRPPSRRGGRKAGIQPTEVSGRQPSESLASGIVFGIGETKPVVSAESVSTDRHTLGKREHRASTDGQGVLNKSVASFSAFRGRRVSAGSVLQ